MARNVSNCIYLTMFIFFVLMIVFFSLAAKVNRDENKYNKKNKADNDGQACAITAVIVMVQVSGVQSGNSPKVDVVETLHVVDMTARAQDGACPYKYNDTNFSIPQQEIQASLLMIVQKYVGLTVYYYVKADADGNMRVLNCDVLNPNTNGPLQPKHTAVDEHAMHYLQRLVEVGVIIGFLSLIICISLMIYVYIPCSCMSSRNVLPSVAAMVYYDPQAMSVSPGWNAQMQQAEN